MEALQALSTATILTLLAAAAFVFIVLLGYVSSQRTTAVWWFFSALTCHGRGAVLLPGRGLRAQMATYLYGQPFAV